MRIIEVGAAIVRQLNPDQFARRIGFVAQLRRQGEACAIFRQPPVWKGLQFSIANTHLRMLKFVLPGHRQCLGFDQISGGTEFKFKP